MGGLKPTFNALSSKIAHWWHGHEGQHRAANTKPLKIIGATPEQWAFLFRYLRKGPTHHLMVCPTAEEAERLYSTCHHSFTGSRHQLEFFPGLEHSPYGGIFSSESNLYRRFHLLDRLSSRTLPTIVVCSIEALKLKVPPPSFFQDNALELEVSDIISPLELGRRLVALGYTSSITVEEPGTFSHKGEIFDLYPISHPPIRLHYFDDMIEEIFPIDPSTYKTDRSRPLALEGEKIRVAVAPPHFSRTDLATTLRKNLPLPSPKFKERFELRKHIFSQLSQGHLFEDYVPFAPLFFEDPKTLLHYLRPKDTLIHFIESGQLKHEALEFKERLHQEYDALKESPDSVLLLPPPEFLYEYNLESDGHLKNFKALKVMSLDMEVDFDPPSLEDRIELQLDMSKTFINRHINFGPTSSRATSRFDTLKRTFLFLKEHFSEGGGHLVFSYHNESAKKEMEYLLELAEFGQSQFHFVKSKLDEGLYYPSENTLILTEGDLFSRKQDKVKRVATSQKVDLFAEQLASLAPGDFVMHKDHGLGQYLGLETLEAGGIKSDYVVVSYRGGDKIYVPVYKIDLVQKHASASAQLTLANLRSSKYKLAKARAKSAAKALAFDLLQLQARRQTSKAFAFSPPDHHFREFELSFPFEETPDQAQAIQNVLDQMQKDTPMDHLICGDVGFGKTEVAMRVAFKAILDSKQVAILVPTTLLALQHYHTFRKRFEGFAVHIDFLSRLKGPKEERQIKEKVAQGTIDILIGTHKLLSPSVTFKNLGLVIVDEEQRFGVGHKEKLKLLKSSVDFLTLTATPIPRTLQLAFLGLRDLSLIQTAPPKRQSIKSYFVKENPATLTQAIEKELARGGQVFIVHNRVQDMESYREKIQELVPQAKIISAHGQLPERELEARMSAFYGGTYQVLIATTIIESGLDIPNANTMIIDRAHTYGLAQLHQLRGRIGRSDKKAYAYFVIPQSHKGHKVVGAMAEKRLKALQTYADIGSGFSLASSDLEIRGAGDILGASQSGHIESVGLELYMDLLKEAIHEIKGEKRHIIKKNMEITTPFASYISHSYIPDAAERLKQYKRLANCNSLERLEEYREELTDIFGPFPPELGNLFIVLESRLHLQLCGVHSVQVAQRTITLTFDKEMLERDTEWRDRIVQSFLGRPKTYKFTPDYQVIYAHKGQIGQQDMLNFSRDIAQQITPC